MDKSVRVEIEKYSAKAREYFQHFKFKIAGGVVLSLNANDKAHAIKRFREMNPDVVFLID